MRVCVCACLWYGAGLVGSTLYSWNDVGWHDTFNQIKTPKLDKLVKEESIIMNNYYVYRFCSPTRSTFMSGRYPWHIGQQVTRTGDRVPVPRGHAVLRGWCARVPVPRAHGLGGGSGSRVGAGIGYLPHAFPSGTAGTPPCVRALDARAHTPAIGITITASPALHTRTPHTHHRRA